MRIFHYQNWLDVEKESRSHEEVDFKQLYLFPLAFKFHSWRKISYYTFFHYHLTSFGEKLLYERNLNHIGKTNYSIYLILIKLRWFSRDSVTIIIIGKINSLGDLILIIQLKLSEESLITHKASLFNRVGVWKTPLCLLSNQCIFN